MSTPRSLLAAPLLLTLPIAGACTSGPPPPAPEDEARVVALGRPAARALVRGLGSRLAARLDEEGPAGAVRFCSGAAQPLTRGIEDEVGPGLALARTSLRPRNPRNAPDALERSALLHFQGTAQEDGELPEHMVQRAGPEAFRYYEPLVVTPLCLECHGPRRSLDPGVRDLLDRRYPDDRATGYRVGDLRGVVRVTVPGARISEDSDIPDRENP